MSLSLLSDINNILSHDKQTAKNPAAEQSHKPVLSSLEPYPMQSSPSFTTNSSRTPLPSNPTVGMAYVPFQQWGEVYDADKAFSRYTLFPQLDLPFEREEIK